jgi:uncharacterized protein (TIGR00251 family)
VSAVRIAVRVQPRASRTEVAGRHGDAVKIRVAAPPVEGAANKELIAFLAKRLGLSKSALEVVKGAQGRDKLIEIEGLTEKEVRERLA